MPGTKNIFRLLNKLNPDDPELTNDALSDLEKMAAVNTIARVLSKLSALQWVIAILAGVVAILAALVLASIGWQIILYMNADPPPAREIVYVERVTQVPPPPPVEEETDEDEEDEDDDEDERAEQARASASN